MTVRPPADTAVAEADLQQQVLDFLDGSSFGPAGGGKRIDTHASMVFLGADRALKIKRAVRLPFLDYSTLEKRKRACEEELRSTPATPPSSTGALSPSRAMPTAPSKSMARALPSNGRSK